MTHFENHSSREQVLKAMKDDFSNLQPEADNFVLMELQIGKAAKRDMYTYLIYLPHFLFCS